ncbi:MAG: CheR family methyltransferase [Salinivirgaceae bacterium]
MKLTLPEDTISQLSAFITTNLALNFPKERWADLERNIKTAAKEFGYNDVQEFIRFIITSPLTRESIEILAANLTVNETYFWREPQTFEALEQVIIPKLIHKKQKGEKRIRIWSAGCSTGEEPYSIAIALNRTIPDIKEWDISIIATDINPRIFHKAKAGEYGQWSFRGAPQWLKDDYFVKKPNHRFEIIPRIKDMVKFEYLNLAEDIYPSVLNNTNAMDIIYCRNVLMYFTQDRFRQVVRGLYNSLVQGGYLVVSASELSMQNFPDFVPINISGMMLYQKDTPKVKKHSDFPLYGTSVEPVLFKPLPKPHEIGKEAFVPAGIQEQIVPVYEESLKPYLQGNYPSATGKLSKTEQTPEEQLLLIKDYANRGKLTEALKLCEKAIAANKTDLRLHYLYATILKENNRFDDAIASLKRAIYLDTDFILAYYSLGNIYQQRGNVKSAKKQYQTVITLLNNHNRDDIIFESEGLTTGRFREIINASLQANT